MRPKSYYGKMTPRLANQVRDLYFSRQFKQREIAEMYGIQQGSVSRIVSNLVWAGDRNATD
jgi:DNA-binding transcriptional regulator LsrR (DeoR family)